MADSEASAIRVVDLQGSDAALQTIIGVGLFDFGDVDGVGDAVRLQHPLGREYYDGLLYVADTYNSRIQVFRFVKEKVSSTGKALMILIPKACNFSQ